MKRLKKTLIVTFFTAAFAAVLAGAVSAGDVVSIQRATYELERAEFFYFNGEYLKASILLKKILKNSPEFSRRNRAVLLKWLSDMRINYREESPPKFRGASFQGLTGLVELLETLYKQGDYEGFITLSKGLEGSPSLFYRSLGLYGTWRFDEAEEFLLDIPFDNSVYPYTRIMLAQISALKNDFDEAENYLNELKGPLPGLGAELIARANLKLGFLLFEKGEFEKAERSFLEVPRSSRFYRQALEGAAWSRIKRGLCGGALDIIDDLTGDLIGEVGPLAPEADPGGQEILIAAAYCEYKLGKFKEAKVRLAGAVNNLQALESAFRGLSNGIPAKIVKKVREEKNGKNVIDGEMLKEVLETGPEVEAAHSWQLALEKLKAYHEKKYADAELFTASLAERIKKHEAGLKDAKKRIELIRRLLSLLSRKVYVVKDGEPVLVRGERGLEAIEKSIAERWEKRLNRRLTDLEKRVVHFICLDGKTGIWYLNNTVHAEPLFWMAIDLTKYGQGGQGGPGGYGKGILERMVLDLDKLVRGSQMAYEKELPALEVLALEKLDYENRLLTSSEELKTRAAGGLKRAEEGLALALELKKDAIERSAGMLAYELRVLKKKAVTTLEGLEREEKVPKK